jgi:lysophospholipase L1-like esterase
VTNSLNNIRWYEAELDRTFKHLKKCFPGKPILVVSVGDRDGKIGTEILTMRSVPAIIQMQRNLARKHGLLFYDLFWGMGGPNTMLRFSYHRPRWANTDYTHLTHEGGKVVGIMFAKLFLQEQAKWRVERKPQ